MDIIDKKKRHLQASLKWSRENPEKVREIRKQYRLRHLERIRKTNREWARKNRKWRTEYEKIYRNIPKNKLHYKKYMEQWHLDRREKLTGVPKPKKCPVCKRKPVGGKRGKGRMVVDHCHRTGKIRGWICDDCNVALGRVDDSITTLKALIEYLKKV